MSYLLRGRNATNPLGGGSLNKGSRFIPPNRAATSGMYRLSAGGAQVQIQRQQQTIQQKQAPQQQQRVAGVISMEEGAFALVPEKKFGLYDLTVHFVSNRMYSSLTYLSNVG
jgi:hypothetical protein